MSEVLQQKSSELIDPLSVAELMVRCQNLEENCLHLHKS